MARRLRSHKKRSSRKSSKKSSGSKRRHVRKGSRKGSRKMHKKLSFGGGKYKATWEKLMEDKKRDQKLIDKYGWKKFEQMKHVL